MIDPGTTFYAVTVGRRYLRDRRDPDNLSNHLQYAFHFGSATGAKQAASRVETLRSFDGCDAPIGVVKVQIEEVGRNDVC